MEKSVGQTLRAAPEADERRQYQRVEPEGATVDVVRSGATTTFAIDNLSEGGALIAGRIPGQVGDTIDLRVKLPALAPIGLPSRLLRHVPREGKEYTAVMFLETSEDLTVWISDVVLQGLRAAFPEL